MFIICVCVCVRVTCLLSRYITTLLEDVVFFVIMKENIGGQRRDAISEEGTPDRDRQKLLREQNVLKEVGASGRGYKEGLVGELFS